MKHCLPVLAIAGLLLIGCEKARFNDDITEAYGLPDKSQAYEKLVARDPKSLSDDELYSRVLTAWGTPYREIKVPTSAGNAHVIVSGPADGEPIILMHGMNTNSTMWYPNVQALSKKYRVYAIDDILGQGKSTPNQEVDSVKAVTAWYLEIFDALQLQKTTLIGASRGGWFATKLALTNPERINKLILLSPAQTFIWLKPSMDFANNLLFLLNPKRKNFGENLETMSSDVQGINQLYIDELYRKVKNSPLPPLIMSMQPFDDEQLAQLSMPVLVLAGEEDMFNNQDSIKRAKEFIPCAKAEIIDNSGHFISVDQAELVNAKIMNFIDENQEANNPAC